jgi:hypothetical protein
VTKRFGAGAIKDGGQALKGSICGLSFSADTQVLTPDGPRPIASIKPGDTVLAYDTTTKQLTAQMVERVFVNYDSDLVDITLERTEKTTENSSDRAAGAATRMKTTETIHTTANHPWLTADRGWIEAGALQVDEPVQLANGSVALVDRVRKVGGVGTMYDLGLGQIHTFAVGARLYVVHNCPPDTDIAFGQKGVSPTFGHGKFKGRSIEEVSNGLTTGEISPDELPIKFVMRGSRRVAVNNRSLLTLRRANLEPTMTEDVSGVPYFERRVGVSLAEMGGPSDEITVRPGKLL